jgi:hypothetical protein
MRKKALFYQPRAAYVLRVGIEGSSPRIWRKLRVPGDYTLGDLHAAIQLAFGWTNSHLHAFTIDTAEYGPPEIDDTRGLELFDGDVVSEDNVCLDELKLREKQSFSYLYDFGDDWAHKVTVSKIIPIKEDADLIRPVCLGGKYAGPLEDVGGIWGYSNMLEALKDPEHPDHGEMLEWAGEYNSEYFNLDEINQALDKAFMPAKAPEAPKSARTGKKTAEKTVKANNKKAPAKTSKTAGKSAGPSAGKKTKPKMPNTAQLRELYALMARVKALEPWKKLWDSEIVVIQFPDEEEPVACCVMGKAGETYGIVVYPGLHSIASYLRVAEAGKDESIFAALGYQDCLLCHMGGRNELFPEEREQLKELGISFRGKNDWVYFRKAKPGLLPWHINRADADFLIAVLTHFISAYTFLVEKKLAVNFEQDEVLFHAYSEKHKAWVSSAGKLPDVPDYITPIAVNADQLDPLRFKPQNNMSVEMDTLHFPIAIAENKEGTPILMRWIVFVDESNGIIVDQHILEPEETVIETMLNRFHEFIKQHNRPKTILVRTVWDAAVLEDFCKKLNIELIHSEGLPTIDEVAEEMLKHL